jgi:DNA-binding MarR family transcriptional regulator
MTESEISERVLTTLRQIIHAIDIHSRALVKQYGLTGPQLLILKKISTLNEATVSEIAKEVNLSQATVTDILERLEVKGYLFKERSNIDKRKVIVRIKEKGLNIVQKRPSLLQDQFLNEFKKLKEWEQTLILSSIQRISSMMNAREISESPFLVSGPITATEKDVEDFFSEENTKIITRKEKE